MATMIDRKRGTRTVGEPEALMALMIPAQMKHAVLKVKATERYATLVVLASIRRDGFTDAGQRLEMSVVERAQWVTDHPLPE